MNSISANLNLMIKACEKASKILIRDFGEIEKLQVSRKGPTDFVTNSDIKTEKIIIEELKKAKPNYSILSEEFGIEKNKHRFYKKNYARNKLKLNLNKKIILFGCSNFEDLRKGASIINKIIDKLEQSKFDLKNLILLTYGDKGNFTIRSKEIQWIHLGNINSAKKMNMIYRASDLSLIHI